MELRVSLDEREDPDEEQEVKVEGLPFVVSNDVIDSYGLVYSVTVGENGIPDVRSPMQPANPAPAADAQPGETEACPLSQAAD